VTQACWKWESGRVPQVGDHDHSGLEERRQGDTHLVKRRRAAGSHMCATWANSEVHPV